MVECGYHCNQILFNFILSLDLWQIKLMIASVAAAVEVVVVVVALVVVIIVVTVVVVVVRGVVAVVVVVVMVTCEIRKILVAGGCYITDDNIYLHH